jgi:hypothetical protein
VAAPFVPQADSEVLERLRAALDPQSRALRRLRKELADNPKDLALAMELAGRYARVGRALGDPRYYGYARAALAPWWQLERPPPQVLVLRATIRQSRHDFDGALDDLALAIEMRPQDAQAWLNQAIILQLRGDYEAALRSCLPLLQLTSALTATTCISSTAALHGQAENSYRLLLRRTRGSSSVAPQERLWALTVLAEIAASLGDAQTAEGHFKQALSLEQGNSYLLAAYADLLLDMDRHEDVIGLLQDHTRSDGLLLRLAEAEKRLNLPQLGLHVASLDERFAATRLRGDAPHLRNEARFELRVRNEFNDAFQLAQDNWAVQREPLDARLLLEAALAAGQGSAVGPIVDWLKDAKLENIHIQHLVSQIEYAGR